MATAVKPNLPPLPAKIARLLMDKRGFPVPYFVATINGEPDFRVIDPVKMKACLDHMLCWICGEHLYKGLGAFVIGPMCAINKVSAEPPSHPECADFAVHACPFMLHPMQKRNIKALPTDVTSNENMDPRNPGVMLIYLTRKWKVDREGDAHYWRLGPAYKTLWYVEGRPAKRHEVQGALESGLARIQPHAEEEGPEAVAALLKGYSEARKLVPR